MTDIIRKLLDRAPRYQVADPDHVVVTLRPCGEDAPHAEPLHARLANLSVGGAKIGVDRVLGVDDKFDVRIEADGCPEVVDVVGQVRWTDPGNGDGWWVGFAFNPQVPDQVLRAFAESGVLDRREHRRIPISLRTTAIWELNGEPTSAWVLNYSKGGFCILAQSDCNPGERLRLQFTLDDGRKVTVRGKSQWQIEADEGFAIGCSFVDPSDARIIEGIANSEPVDEGPARGRLHELLKNRPLVVGAAVAALAGMLVGMVLVPLGWQPGRAEASPGRPAANARGDVAAKPTPAPEPAGDSNEQARKRDAPPGVPPAPIPPDVPIENALPSVSVASLPKEPAAKLDNITAPLAADEPSSTKSTSPPRSAQRRSQFTPATIGVALPIDLRITPAPSGELDANSATVDAGAPVNAVSGPSREAPTETAPQLVKPPVPNDTKRPAESPRLLILAPPIDDRDAQPNGAAQAADEIPAPNVSSGPDSPASSEPAPPRAPEFPIRRWVDKTGRHTIQARFVALDGDRVRLQQTDGRYTVIARKLLSAGDTQYLDLADASIREYERSLALPVDGPTPLSPR